MTRQQKTPKQRAEEQLAVAKRQAERLTEQWKKSRAETERLSKEREAAVVRRDYLSKNPDLEQPIHPTTEEKHTP